MADGALTIHLKAPVARALASAAEQAGLSPEDYVVARLTESLDGGSARGASYDWTEADRRLAEYDRTGEYITLEHWSDEFRADVEARLASNR